MFTVNLSLPEQLQAFVDQQIESGKYASAEEVIVDALKVFAAEKHLNKSQTEASIQAKTPEELGWPAGFFEQTAGCLQDDPLVRYPQGEYEAAGRLG